MTGGNSIDVVLHDLTENPALEGSSSCFSTGDLLSAPLDASQGELLDDFDFEPTPLPNSRPSPPALFEPTPMRNVKPQLVKSVVPSTPQFPPMFPQQQQVVAQPPPPHMMMQQQQQQQRHQVPLMNHPPPQNAVQAQQLQAALQNLRRVNQMGQQPMHHQPPNMVVPMHQQQLPPHQQQQMTMPQQPQMPNCQVFPPSPHPAAQPPQQTRSFSHSPPPPPRNGNLKAYSTAMEKLCVTMKRSAMSRNMVKQLSGRNLSKQGGSQRNLLTKQGSSSQRTSSLVKQNSGRDLGALARQASGRNLMSHSPTPPDAPLRRSLHESKHRIITLGGSNHGSGGAPNNTKRGLFRHNSSSALMGNNNNRRTQLQLDDCNLGYLFDGPTDNNNSFPHVSSMAL